LTSGNIKASSLGLVGPLIGKNVTDLAAKGIMMRRRIDHLPVINQKNNNLVESANINSHRKNELGVPMLSVGRVPREPKNIKSVRHDIFFRGLELNQSLRNRDKVKYDAIAQLSAS
jgi:hypothetical protein